MSPFSNARRQRGVTLIEVMMSASIGITALSVASALTSTTTSMAQESHANARAHTGHRRGVLALSNVLRTAGLLTLDGFTAAGTSEEPIFRRILGVDMHQHLYGDPERLEWRKADRAVPGVAEPGAVWLVDKAGARVVAERVPAGGFEVRKEGSVLAIRLTTYYATSRNTVAEVSSETAVSLRN